MKSLLNNMVLPAINLQIHEMYDRTNKDEHNILNYLEAIFDILYLGPILKLNSKMIDHQILSLIKHQNNLSLLNTQMNNELLLVTQNIQLRNLQNTIINAKTENRLQNQYLRALYISQQIINENQFHIDLFQQNLENYRALEEKREQRFGQISDQKLNGVGIKVREEQTYFSAGQFQDDMRNGIAFYAQDDFFDIGIFNRNSKMGRQVQIHVNGTVTRGDDNGSDYSLNGSITKRNGVVLKGLILSGWQVTNYSKDGKFTGRKENVLGVICEGEFGEQRCEYQNGTENWVGSRTYPNGDVQIGRFVDNFFVDEQLFQNKWLGKGWKVDYDGTICEGEFKGQPEDWDGVKIYPCGAFEKGKFAGNFIQDANFD